MTNPPIDFGMDWTAAGERRRRGESLPLHVASSANDDFSDAYRHARGPMTAAGFSWTDLCSEYGKLQPAWWDHGTPVDVPALQAAVDAAIAVGAAERLERDHAAEARRAEADARHQAMLADVRKISGPIRAALDAIIQDRPWAIGRHLTEARDLVAPGDWTWHGLRTAERYIENAAANIARAEARLSRPAPAAWFARAADPSVRAAALEACRVLSARDEDWASDRNGVGWSQATSWTGHVLSERDALDQGSASHALHLLHTHRRQIPAELRDRLFGGAPAPEPAQAALAL